jgi:hypothetical protein
LVFAKHARPEQDATIQLDIPTTTVGKQPVLRPELNFATFSADLAPAPTNKNVFLLHVRNDATSPHATAKDVIAHIGYRAQNGHGMNVDYGTWMETSNSLSIRRGETKRLVIALTDGGKNFAINFTGPRTNFTSSCLAPAGEITSGQWMMVVRINAEDYEKVGYFLLTVENNGAVNCQQIKQLLW